MTTPRNDARTVYRRTTEMMADGSLGWISPSQLYLLRMALAKRRARKRAETR